MCEQPRQLSCHRIQSTSRRAMYTPVTIFDIDHSLHFPLSLPYQMSHKYSTFILNALPSRQVEGSFLAARIYGIMSARFSDPYHQCDRRSKGGLQPLDCSMRSILFREHVIWNRRATNAEQETHGFHPCWTELVGPQNDD